MDCDEERIEMTSDTLNEKKTFSTTNSNPLLKKILKLKPWNVLTKSECAISF